MMTKDTCDRWTLRIREWRASGLSANEFARGKGYSGAGLRSAESQLRSAAVAKGSAQLTAATVDVAAHSQAPRFLPVRVREAERASVDVVVEVGQARIRLSPDTDLAFVSDIVRALSGVL